jgi:putative Mn2+ efflux pump MntP
MIERMETRGEFARGVGFGLARIIQHFPINDRERMLDRLDWDPLFSEGFGEGTAQFLWTIYGEANKQQFLKLTKNSPEISKGLGTGLGFMHFYSKNELSHESYKHIFKTDPNFRRGLGTGMGRAYKYLSEDDHREALRMSEEDVEFAIGFGEGIGRVYNHLEASEKELVMSYVNDEDTGFSRGLGVGFGSVFSYFEEDVKKDILARISHNDQLSMGLGTGLGMHISYISEALAFQIFELARNNSFLASGLGEGCGIMFPYLPQSTKHWLSSKVSIDGFAFGFGIGIGKIRKYVKNTIFEEAAAFTKSINFMKGFGIGLGSVTAKLSKELMLEILSKTAADAYFAKNFGFGTGHNFSLLDDYKRKDILEIMRHSEEYFLAGLGEGLGHSLPSTGSRLVEEIMQTIGSVNLARGTARGVTESFIHLNLAEVLRMLEYAAFNPEYGKVLGEGLAEKFAVLDEEKQSWILDSLQKDSPFSKTFAKMIHKNMVYLSPQTRERINGLAAKFPHLKSRLKKRDMISD